MNDKKRGKPFLDYLRTLLMNRPAENLLARLTHGKKWDSLVARIPPNYYQYKPGSIRSVTRDGFHLELDLSEYMQWLIFFGVVTEPRNSLYNLVKPGMTVLDIGANIGETALQFSRLTGDNGTVLAFEPFPATYGKLLHHISINACKNVHAFHVALSNKKGSLMMSSTPGNSGGNRIDAQSGTVTVESVTLDGFLESQPEFKPDLIKIDVEGFEMHVLSGASATLSKFKPALFLEVNDTFLRNAGSSGKELFEIITSAGYTITDASTGRKLTAAEDFLHGHTDVIAK